jgi:DNA-binding transcriptional ArsR family regulator
MTSTDDRKKTAQIFKALAHLIRLHIVKILLEDEKCMNDIRDLFDATQPNISQHLNILKYSGIVDFRQSGNLRCYYLQSPEKIKRIIQAVKDFVLELGAFGFA